VLTLLDRKLAAVEAQLETLTEVRTELLSLQKEVAVTSKVVAAVCGIIEQHCHGCCFSNPRA
jgi:hypothetical protein